ncbi:putative membrane protein YjcC [Marinomonas aquimarina]|uniref:cyclic-guanylate-specific phosphodiesterase n=1 Tax=Marinomonas aquimarina TaxID=295068 RepID=A0A1A8TJ94_9GAMM|nr:EAL domain-containing protein [Marinomonas aquimarina]SBS32587.1 putative membrane protein YjcC [Marinomonas aquimarina]
MLRLLQENARLIIRSSMVAFACALLALWMAHITQQKSQYKELKSYSHYTLNYASEVTKDLKLSISEAHHSPHEICSEQDIAWLRTVLWSHKYLKDIGRMVDGSIQCSAERGWLPFPITLPQPDKQLSNGVNVWRNSAQIVGTLFEADMAQDGNVITITSPFAFDAMREPSANISAIVVNQSTNYVFRSFGLHAEALAEQMTRLPSWFSHTPSTTLHYYDCSEVGLCVLAEDRASGVLGLSWLSTSMIALLGGFGGLGISSLIYRNHRRRHSMAHHLKKTIQNNDLNVVFQPKICLANGRPVGAEALVRWNSHYFGMVSPDVFISVAEKKGLIRQITHLVIEKSLSKMQHVLRANPDFKLSINVSIQDLMDPALLPCIVKNADTFGIRLAQLVFEITERSAGDHDRLAEVVREYIAAGVSISLDDFGTGYSNLAWLGHLNATEIKVDKSFTQSIGTGSINQTMLDAIFSLLQGLNVVCVFEGVETQEQADYIYQACPEAQVQGWLYAKPMIIAQFESYFELAKQKG